jgi:hypothetical protein
VSRGGIPGLGGDLGRFCEERNEPTGARGFQADRVTRTGHRFDSAGVRDMTRERMQAMAQGRDGILLAPMRAPKFAWMARRLSVIAAMLAVVSFAAGSSFAQDVHHKNPGVGTLDTVVITNYGAAFAGSVSTYPEGSRQHARPFFQIKGTNTGLGNSSGPAHVSVSSFSNNIAVAIPFDNFGGVDFAGDISGCGPFGVVSPPLYGTGAVEIFPPGGNDNTHPTNIICSPDVAFEFAEGVTDTNTTGIFVPQGVAYESPFDGVNPGHDILAVANEFPEVMPGADADLCAAFMLPTATEGTLGTVTEYDVTALPAGINNIEPFANNPYAALNPFVDLEYTANTTIAGCFTLMTGPEALTFDDGGFLYVVNNAGSLEAALETLPREVTVYAPGMYGDVFPTALVGSAGTPTAGDLLEPTGIAVESFPLFTDNEMFVADQGDDSIKVFAPFTNFATVIYYGTLIATIKGGATHLGSPEGVAIGPDDDTLYVANQSLNSFEMFVDIDSSIAAGGTIPVVPTLIVRGKPVRMLQPIGLALDGQFTPSSTTTITTSPTFTSSIEATPAP